ncbi:hypothetical protein QBC41DRAFT_275520 [Cercophora samala]|uniref:Uncharacterized protein n=1 Tax=Cercophora samala TaxID=330535 RepID=A0AA40DCN7_9PEZI|nr:hypothetical protein QBC41DRAFT_275520 [Cercophora samala]
MAYFSDPPASIIPSHMLASHGSGLNSFSDSDVELPQLPAPQALVAAHPSTARQAGSQGNFSSNVVPIGSHTSGIVLYNDTNLLGDGQQLYYSKNRRDRQRNKQSRSEHSGGFSRSFSSDRATAYAIKTAQYPVLYELVKTPTTARKSLASWKSQFTRPSTQEGNTTTGDQRPGAPLSNTAPPTTLVAGSATSPVTLPPQHMSFSEPLLEKTRRGSRFVVTCELEKAYPNFHIQCEYIYLNQQERTNQSQTDTRISLANIATKENLWVVAMEQIGYNEAFLRGLVGDEEYSKLDRVSGPVKGHDKYSGPSIAAKVAKKIKIPEGYDLGNIWCQAADFYTMKIFIPSKEYRM